MGTLADFGSSYRSHAEAYGFRPLEVVDVMDSLRANQQTNERSLQRILDSKMDVRRMDTQVRNNNVLAQNQANRFAREQTRTAIEESERNRLKQAETQQKLQQAFDEKQLNELSQFSKTITDGLVQVVQWDTERRVQNWMNEAFTIGLPQEELESFEALEKQAEAAGANAKLTGATLETVGAPVDLIERARNATGWKKYAYTKAIMMMAGDRYQRYREDNASTFTVNIGGKPVSLTTAENSSEYAAIERSMRDQFLSQFHGLNRGMMNKYLFPKMRQYEEAAAKAFGNQQREKLQSQREHEYASQVRALITSGQSAETVQQLWTTYAGDFGGRGKSRDKFIEVTKTLLDGGGLSPSTVANINEMLDTEVKWDDGSTKSINEKYAYQLAKAGFGESLRNAELRPIQLATESRRAVAQDFENQYFELRASRQAPFTDKEELAFLNKASDLGIRHLVENSIQNDLTVQDLDVEEAQDIVQYHLANKGYVSEHEARTLPIPVVANLRAQGKIQPKDKMTIPTSMMDNASQRIVNRANLLFNIAGLKEGGKTREYDNFIARAKERIAYEYRDRLMSGAYVSDGAGSAESKAFDSAMSAIEERMQQMGTSYGYKELPDLKSTTWQEKTTKAKKFITNNNNDITLPNPHLDDTMPAVAKYFETGKGRIPIQYQILANGTNGVTAWDYAAAQYKARGGTKVPEKPDSQVMIESLSPDVQSLVNKYQTNARAVRASTRISSQTHLQKSTAKERAALRMLMLAEGTDQIKQEGKTPYQTIFGYQYFDGFNNHPDRVNTSGGYSSAAAGAYQFMPATWKMAKKALGLKDFSPANQDKAGLYLLRKRGFDPNNIDSSLLLDTAGNPTPYAAQLFASISPEWASIPNLAGKSTYGQPVKKLKDLILGYLAFEKEEAARNAVYAQDHNRLPGL